MKKKKLFTIVHEVWNDELLAVHAMEKIKKHVRMKKRDLKALLLQVSNGEVSACTALLRMGIGKCDCPNRRHSYVPGEEGDG